MKRIFMEHKKNCRKFSNRHVLYGRTDILVMNMELLCFLNQWDNSNMSKLAERANCSGQTEPNYRKPLLYIKRDIFRHSHPNDVH